MFRNPEFELLGGPGRGGREHITPKLRVEPLESDSYARSETYTQLETGAAITAAIDALSQFQNEAEVQAPPRPWWPTGRCQTSWASSASNRGVLWLRPSWRRDLPDREQLHAA